MCSWTKTSNEIEGFYLSQRSRYGKQTAILAVMTEKSLSTVPSNSREKSLDKRVALLKIYRPNTGLQYRHESLADIEKKYMKVNKDEAKDPWCQQYDSSANTCAHAYWAGNCRNIESGKKCEV